MKRTKHFNVRQQQRCIPNQVIAWLEEYGDEQSVAGGCLRRYFSKHSKKRMKRELGAPIVQLCSKYLRVEIIESESGRLITNYWKH